MRIVSMCVAFALAVAGISAQQASPKLRPELAKATAVAMHFSGAVSDAVLTLGQFAGVDIQVAPDVADTLKKTKFAATLKATTFEDALVTLLGYAALTYEVIDDHTVRVIVRPSK